VFDEVIERIKTGERPLGVYIFSSQREAVEKLRRHTISGGFCVMCASLQGAQESLGFGGVGKSGMGRHHGFDGFREFSNPRGVFELAADADIAPLESPHAEQTQAFVRAMTSGALG